MEGNNDVSLLATTTLILLRSTERESIRKSKKIDHSTKDPTFIAYN